MQIEFGQQFLFEVDLRVIGAEQETVGQNHRTTSVLFQTVHNDRHKEIGSLGRREVSREVVLHFRFLAAAIGRIHQDHVELVIRGIVQNVAD